MKTSIEIDLGIIDEDDLFAHIVKRYSPEEVFPIKELEEWARGEGWSPEGADRG